MANAKRRILFLITTADWGGAQFFVTRVAKEIIQRGHHALVAYGEEGELAARCAAAGIPTARIENVHRRISPWHDLASIYEMRRLIREFKPDAVHLNSGKMSITGSIAADLERIPCIVYRIGGWSFMEDVSPLRRLAYLLPEKLTAWRKDVIVTVHPGDAEAAKRHGIIPRGQLITIPNGADLASFDAGLLARDEALRALGLDGEDRPIIGTIANFYPPKNLPRYLRIIAPLAKDARFVILGDGPERPAIEAATREAGLDPKDHLLGRRDDASKLLKAFDIFILPSSKEGMPWALVEAMAAGLPCIATDVGACRWMLEPDAGIIVSPADDEALKHAIASLIENPEHRKMLGACARATVAARFQWQDSLNKTLNILGL